jgi:hypothetical protein
MKSGLLCVAVLLGNSVLAGAQSANPHRDPTDFMPPIYRGEGIIDKNNDIHKLEQPDQKNPLQPVVRVDRAQIRRDAGELSRLAQSISSEIRDTEKGVLPKDLSENLKKIQKLSKHLRDELKL